MKRVFANESMIIIMDYTVYMFKENNDNKGMVTCRKSFGIYRSKALNKMEGLFY